MLSAVAGGLGFRSEVTQNLPPIFGFHSVYLFTYTVGERGETGFSGNSALCFHFESIVTPGGENAAQRSRR